MKHRFSIILATFIITALIISCGQKNNPAAPASTPDQGGMQFSLSAADNIASGLVTVSKGALTHALPVSIADHTGTVAFENIQVGHWDIVVQLFDSDGVEIYSGSGTAVVTPGNTTSLVINVVHNTGTLEIIVEVPEDTTGLILWNKLGSVTEIENSQVGLNGTYVSGTFVPGVFGNAVDLGLGQGFVDVDSISFPKETVNTAGKGCIEFWAKLEGVTNTTVMDLNKEITLFKAYDGNAAFLMVLTSNNGRGGGGLCGTAGRSYVTASVYYAVPQTYGQLLGDATAWHHYALVWDSSTLAGVDNGSRKVAVYVDNILKSTYWDTLDEGFPDLTSSALYLMRRNEDTNARVILDNLKVWDTPKTDFSDRFVE